VDFATLKKYATVEKDVQGTGPIGQGDFLKAMGIEHRLALLLQNCTGIRHNSLSVSDEAD
jgi:NADH dehydrogenase [ubiquinone] 1 alpha subcomplex assembly factor 7